jgi:transcriptional regulator with XRE-family HTH domain
MSQRALAAAAGLSTSYVSLIEAGRRVPGDEALRKLARVLQVAPAELLGEKPAVVAVIELELQQAEAALQIEQPRRLLQRLRALRRRYAGALSWDLYCRLQVILGEAERRAGNLERAIAEQEELLAAGGIPDNLMVRVVRVLCAAYLEVGDVERCVELAEQELQRLRRLELAFIEEYIALGGLLTAAYLERGDVVRAEVLAREIVRQSEVDGSTRGRGMAYHSASLAAEARGDRDRASRLAARALAIFTELDARWQLTVMQLEYAQVLLSVDPPDPVQAMALLSEAERSVRSLGTVADVGRWKLLCAQAQLVLGDVDTALANAEEVAGLHDRSSERLVAQALMVTAECGLVRRDMPGALEALNDASTHLSMAEPKRSSSRLWRDLGDLYTRCGATEDAAESYRRALAMAGLPPRRVMSGS